MNKRMQERLEREKLKQMIDGNPRLKQILDGMIDIQDGEFEAQDAVANAIEEKLKAARMQGVLIGWQGFALQAIKNIESMETIEEVKEYFVNEEKKAREKLNLKEN